MLHVMLLHAGWALYSLFWANLFQKTAGATKQVLAEAVMMMNVWAGCGHDA